MELLIKAENENPKKAITMILDDHKEHVKGHLRFIYRPGMLRHIWSHMYLAYRKRKLGLPTVTVEDIIGTPKCKVK